jgi:hypothetical protein
LPLQSFNTFVADVRLSRGCFYFELQVINLIGAELHKWAVGDVIGFALEMRTAGAAVMSVSVNGSFSEPNGVAFRDMYAPFLSPAFTGDGRYPFVLVRIGVIV